MAMLVRGLTLHISNSAQGLDVWLPDGRLLQSAIRPSATQRRGGSHIIVGGRHSRALLALRRLLGLDHGVKGEEEEQTRVADRLDGRDGLAHEESRHHDETTVARHRHRLERHGRRALDQQEGADVDEEAREAAHAKQLAKAKEALEAEVVRRVREQALTYRDRAIKLRDVLDGLNADLGVDLRKLGLKPLVKATLATELELAEPLDRCFTFDRVVLAKSVAATLD